MIAVASKLFLVMLILAGLAACSPPSSPNSDQRAPSGPVLSEWQEGYGGDSSALEATRLIEQLCRDTRELREEYLKVGFETRLDVSGAICELSKPGALFVNSVMQPMVNGEPKDFASFPGLNPKRLEIKREFWKNRGSNVAAVRDLLLHEVVILAGFDDRNFSRSRLLGQALDAHVGKFSEPLACEEGTILAYFAGARLGAAVSLARDYGLVKCPQAFQTIRQFSREPTRNPAFRINTQQGYALGLFMRLTQLRLDSFQAATYVSAFSEAARIFPSLYQPWTESCRELKLREADDNCENILTFIVGATPLEKRAVIGIKNSILSFDRAAALLMQSLPRERSELIVGSRVNGRLVRAAIRSHSWHQLAVLGDIQRSTDPTLEPAWVLMAGLHWPGLRAAGDRWKESTELEARDREDYIRCSPVNVETYVDRLLSTGDLGPCFDTTVTMRRPPYVSTVPLLRPLTPDL